jgi:acetyltransferase-like isoleucine patch superfamily enzyme
MIFLRKLFFARYFVINYLIFIFNKISKPLPKIDGFIVIINKGGKIVFGTNSKINSHKYKNIIGGDSRSSIVVAKGAELIIGNNFKMSNSAICCTNRITIGDDVMIGGSCKIWDTDFHSIDPDIRKKSPNLGSKTAPILISSNVFIGGFSIILKGVTIGANSVIAAGSVVSTNVPTNEVWGGNPAKFIKKLESNE